MFDFVSIKAIIQHIDVAKQWNYERHMNTRKSAANP